MLKAYLSVIHASLILADMRRYHTQLLTVASYIDMISVIFIKGKSLKLHAPMSIHATSVSLGKYQSMQSHFRSIQSSLVRWLSLKEP